MLSKATKMVVTYWTVTQRYTHKHSSWEQTCVLSPGPPYTQTLAQESRIGANFLNVQHPPPALDDTSGYKTRHDPHSMPIVLSKQKQNLAIH